MRDRRRGPAAGVTFPSPAWSIRWRSTADHVRHHIDREDAAPGTDGPRQPEREVAGTGADVGHRVAGLHGERRHHLVRSLPGVGARPTASRDVGVEVVGVAVAIAV